MDRGGRAQASGFARQPFQVRGHFGAGRAGIAPVVEREELGAELGAKAEGSAADRVHAQSQALLRRVLGKFCFHRKSPIPGTWITAGRTQVPKRWWSAISPAKTSSAVRAAMVAPSRCPQAPRRGSVTSA